MTSAVGAWTPPVELVADTRRVIAGALRETPEERFEASAWDALLQVVGPELLTRSQAPSHLTASAIVLSPDARQVCLVLHGKIRRWVQPGGHLEPGDTSLLAAAQREILEETGLPTVDPGCPRLLSRHGAPCAPGVVDWHLDVQHVLVGDVVPPSVSEESQAVDWWPVDGLPSPSAWGVADLVRRGVALLRGLG